MIAMQATAILQLYLLVLTGGEGTQFLCTGRDSYLHENNIS